MDRKHRYAAAGQPIELSVEHADNSVRCYSHRRQCRLHLACYKGRCPDVQAAGAVVGQADDAQPIVSCCAVAIAENVIDITIIWINCSVIGATEQGVDGTELEEIVRSAVAHSIE